MKIQPDKLTHLQNGEAKKAENKQSAEFQNLLNKEMGKQVSSGLSPGTSKTPSLQGPDPLFQLRAGQDASPNNRQAVMDKFDTLLSRWDEYTSSIQSSRPDLRKANQVLEEISAELSQVRSSLKDSNVQNEGVGSILEELEILTVTERIKFNRGDYI